MEDLTEQLPLYGFSNFGKFQSPAAIAKYLYHLCHVASTIYLVLGRRKTFIIDKCNYGGAASG